ncbi:MAG: response regulator [Pseudobacteriovorax sp.]|nr:response regulator [Pseudobacteriovorax sp.]
MKILITDDAKAIHSFIKINLQSDGYELHHAYDGQEAVNRLKAEAFDLVLLDWEMPVKNGIDALKEIRSFDVKTKIIMVTGNTRPESIHQAFGLGANGFLKKPFDPNQLKSTISQKMQQDSAQEEIAIAEHNDGKSYHVLVADDEPDLIDLITDILEDVKGVKVTAASNGEKAIETLHEHYFDAIITDLNMPKVNGMQLIQTIKNNKAHQFTPLYILSGEISSITSRFAQNNLVTELKKPFDPDQLIDLLESEVFGSKDVAHYHETVVEAFIDSSRDVMNCNFASFKPGSLTLCKDIDQTYDMTSYIGILGAGVRGNLIVNCDKLFIEDLLINLFGGDSSFIDEDISSYLGELTNQIAGGFTNKLKRYSLNLQITVPELSEGPKNPIVYLTKSSGLKIPIKTRKGRCDIFLLLTGVNPEKIIEPVEPMQDTGVFF